MEDDSVISEADSEQLIGHPAPFVFGIGRVKELNIHRRKQWNRLLRKYTKMEGAKGYLHTKDLSVYSANKSSANVSRTSKVSTYKTHSRKTIASAFQIISKHYKFLCSYVTEAEIQQTLLDYKINKISLVRLIEVVEIFFKSNLKQLLIAREEARYLGYRKFNKYDRAAECEAERLQQFLGKKYVAIYISVHSIKPIEDIIYLIEEKHKSDLATYFLKNPKNRHLKAEDREVLQHNFVSEWGKLKQFIPAEYLVQYCEMLEDM